RVDTHHTTCTSPLSLHDALPISLSTERLTLALKASDLTLWDWNIAANTMTYVEQLNNPTHTQEGGLVEQLAPYLSDEDKHDISRSEEHTSELQSRFDLVCRLLLE